MAWVNGSVKRVILPLVAWIAVWAFWSLVTRAFHPTLTIALCATAALIASYAAFFYFHEFVLAPMLLRSRRGVYAAAFLFSSALFGVVGVVSVQLLYDVLWGPDPRRFGFWQNFVSDYAGLLIHFIGAKTVGKIILRSGQARS